MALLSHLCLCHCNYSDKSRNCNPAPVKESQTNWTTTILKAMFVLVGERQQKRRSVFVSILNTVHAYLCIYCTWLCARTVLLLLVWFPVEEWIHRKPFTPKTFIRYCQGTIASLQSFQIQIPKTLLSIMLIKYCLKLRDIQSLQRFKELWLGQETLPSHGGKHARPENQAHTQKVLNSLQRPWPLLCWGLHLNKA